MILALLAIALFGAGSSARLRGGLRAVAGAAFGIGAWSSGYAAALLLGVPLAAKDVAIAALGALLLFRRRLPADEAAASVPAPRRPWLFFAAAVALAAAAFVEHTVRFPDGGYDAWMIWNTRARFLVRAADFRTAFSPDLSFWLHTDYPWLVPGVVAQAFTLARSQSLALPALVSAVFGALCLAALVFAVARLRGVRWGLLAGLALATTPCFPTFASNQQSDVPLALFLLLSCALLAGDLFLLAGFAAGLGAWTKNEGLLYLACLTLALAWRRRSARPVLLFLLGSAPLLALLLLFKLTLPVRNDLLAFSTPQSLLERALDLRRWGALARMTLRRIVFFQDFALWVVAEVLLLALVVRKLPPTVLGTALFLACAAYAPIYVLQPHDLDWIYRTSVNRIFIQLWPSAILATLLALVPAPATART